MKDKNVHRIAGVEPGSIADQLGITIGDVLLQTNGVQVLDVFDYRTAMMAENIAITIRTAEGLRAFDIEKDEDEDVGLIFDRPLMDDCRSCTNRCVFCFIDQLPEGMRQSLYFKDDDLRMSFLTGNYVTLTNLSDRELDRLIGYRLSPMNISIHALSPAVRHAMMGNRFAGDILERLRRMVAHGISVNAQIVLCPGINDGVVLEETLAGLTGLGDRLLSISVVPVGITRYREANRLPDLRSFDRETSAKVLDMIHAWQSRLLAERESRTVYAADEFYLRAGHLLPDAATYEEFPQLENGVGMIPLFDLELREGMELYKVVDRADCIPMERPHIHAVTGTDFAPLLDCYSDAIRTRFDVDWTTHPIRNDFFGESITVAGLVTAGDIAGQLAPALGNESRDVVLVPDTMLRAEGDVFLDDWTPARLQETLRTRVVICGSTAPEMLEALDRIARGEEPL